MSNAEPTQLMLAFWFLAILAILFLGIFIGIRIEHYWIVNKLNVLGKDSTMRNFDEVIEKQGKAEKQNNEAKTEV